MVLQLSAADEPYTPYWAQWLTPVLRPGRHFVPFTLDSMQSRLQWCIDHDDEARAIAAAAQRLMRCSVSLETAERYLGRAMQLVHDTQRPDNHTAAGGNATAGPWW